MRKVTIKSATVRDLERPWKEIELTEEAIRKLPPGRETDALVAEHVFGCKPVKDDLPNPVKIRSGNPVLTISYQVRCRCSGKPKGPHGEQPGYDAIIAFYSTHMEDAWSVWEKIKTPGSAIVYQGARMQKPKGGGEIWSYAVRIKHAKKGAPYECSADTLSLTICRAALLAKAKRGTAMRKKKRKALG
jgi:hypothetical protein